MVIVKMLGGLGNQLFQYAMGRNLAYLNDTELKVDLTWFSSEQETTRRSFFLDKFNITYGVASNEEIKKYFILRKFLGRDLYEAIIPFKCKRYIRLKEFQPFDGKYLKLGGNVYLEGYWTDERYFAEVSNIIRREFTLKHELSQRSKKISELIQKTESVSIHIRRGDYVANRNFSPIFNVCDHKYYINAINEITRNISKPHFFIFSDDIGWARQNIKFGHHAVYVSGGEGDLPHEELVLISRCRHNIISNSTFSWWGAWLNSSDGKTIIAPDRWFNRQGHHGGECVPSTWKKIAVE